MPSAQRNRITTATTAMDHGRVGAAASRKALRMNKAAHSSTAALISRSPSEGMKNEEAKSDGSNKG